MSAISTDINKIRNAVWADEVRESIAHGIEQCYSDVSNPTLQTNALEAALQAKIDEGEMAALTIGDGTITTAKIANGAITQAKLDPNISFEADGELDATSTNAIQNKVVTAAISEVNESLGNQASDLYGRDAGPVLSWEAGYINTTTGEDASNARYCRTTGFIVGEGQYIKFNTSSEYQIVFYTYLSDGTYVGSEQKAKKQDGDYCRVTKTGYKYRFCIYKVSSGAIGVDEASSAVTIYYKRTGDYLGLMEILPGIEDDFYTMQQEVEGGGTDAGLVFEKGNITPATGADAAVAASTYQARTPEYYPGDGDGIIITVPSGFTVNAFAYESDGTFHPYSDGYGAIVTYANSPYTFRTRSTLKYRFTMINDGDYSWEDVTEEYANVTFVKESTYEVGLIKRVYDLENESGTAKLLDGKICAAFGDSITARNVWQPYVAAELGLTMVNCGVGSTCLAGTTTGCFSTDARINTVKNANPDFVTILGGANDLVEENPIGDVSQLALALGSKDRTTFIGAYSYIIETLLAWKPTLNIIILGTTWAHSNGARYSETLTYTDYSDASKKVAQYYGLPFVDLHGELGFNKFTMGSETQYQIYSTDQIHPGDAGGRRIASLVIAKMKECYSQIYV